MLVITIATLQPAVYRIVPKHGRFVIDNLVGRWLIPVNIAFAFVRRFEDECRPVDAIPISSFKSAGSHVDPSIVKQISQVPPAGSTADLSATQSRRNGICLFCFDARQRLGKTRPPRARIELVCGGKQSFRTGGTNVGSDVLFGRERVENAGFLALGPAFAQNIVLGTTQNVGPFSFGALDGVALGAALGIVGGGG